MHLHPTEIRERKNEIGRLQRKIKTNQSKPFKNPNNHNTSHEGRATKQRKIWRVLRLAIGQTNSTLCTKQTSQRGTIHIKTWNNITMTTIMAMRTKKMSIQTSVPTK